MPSFYQLSSEQSISILESTPQGLNESEAAKRLLIHGLNRLQKINAVPLWYKALRQFADPMIILMLAAGGLAFLLGSMRDVIILYSIVLINAVIGFIQEYKAENIIKSLQSFLTAEAKVLRSGKRVEIAAEQLVPGDIVILEEGDAVPADLRLITMNNIATNDFALTGESNPKSKFLHGLNQMVPLSRQDNQLYLGTTVARGNGVGIVYATGMNTEIGKIANVTQAVNNGPTPLEKEIASIATRLTMMAIVLAGVVFMINYLQASPFQASLLAALGIAAALVPQGLPAQLSVILSLGASRLGQKKAIVKQLYSVETLGATNVICSDKTGTITTNEMTVQHIWYQGKDYPVSGLGYQPVGDIANRTELPDQLFRIGVLASTATIAPPDSKHQDWYAIGDPTEAAMMTLAAKAGIDIMTLRTEWIEHKQHPFDSVRKMMSSLRLAKAGDQEGTLFLKGSPVSVLAHCQLTDSEKATIMAASTQYASQSLRVLALASKPISIDGDDSIDAVEQNLHFIGLVAMMDPPREGVEQAIQAAQAAHLRTFMITGDQSDTARAIALRIGMAADADHLTVIEGDTLSSISDADLQKKMDANQALVFARTSPEDKLRIVKLLKLSGYVVAVTGDGVNDAPALKQADIGVAMGKIGTEVAKEAAEIVLTDDSYITLVTAIKEGRTIFANLRKTLFSTLSSNGGELFVVLCTPLLALIGFPASILAIQILLVDLVGEILPLMALTFDPAPDDMMKKPPRVLSHHFLTIKNLLDIAYAAVFMGGMAVINFVWFLDRQGFQAGTILSEDNPFYRRALTITYVTLMMGQFANILSRRHETESLFHRYFWSNPKLLGSIAFSLGLMAIVIYTPAIQYYVRTANLQFEDWLYALLGAVVMIVAHEIRKYVRRRKIPSSVPVLK
ncbi:cation-transporting P-type ATPase [Candidatus Gracilibacteria bacterium]|nr:cation-transporting P-type ATPase [Candidatus Gracilibacteria bacterium]